jgi:streptogramin lyase
MTLRGRMLRGLLVGMLVALAAPASALAIDEFPVTNPCPAAPPSTGGGTCQPAGIAAGPDGALWFTEENGDRIGRITTAGSITEVQLASGTHPTKIAAGPDGRLWFTESGTNQVGAINPSTMAIDITVSTGSQPDGITAGPDGNLWITEFGGDAVRRITSGGSISPPFSTGAGSDPGDITIGPDGRLWFTESNDTIGSSSIGAITTGGGVSHYALPALSDPSGITSTGGALWFTEFGANVIGRISTTGVIAPPSPGGNQPSGIAAGSDGALWFTETAGNAIGRITTAGSLTNEFAVPTPNSAPGDIAAGPDGALWFTEFVGNRIGRIAVAPPFVPPPPPAPLAPPAAQKAKSCKVPKLRGLTVKKARKRLRKAGCRFKIRGKGKVVSSKPKAGTRTTKIVQVKAKQKRTRSKH